jgi:tyrosine-protein kinase Etk/Wzc
MATELSSPGISGRSESSTPSSVGDQEVSLLDIMIILSERKWTIAAITAVFAIVAFVISLLLPARYTAFVTLLPPQQNSSLGGALASQVGAMGGLAALAGAGGGLSLKNPNEMFVAMLRSRTVEDAMVQHFGLMQEYHTRYLSDARYVFEKWAAVDGNGKDGLIHISVVDKSPQRAAELANGYVDQFRRLSEHLAITEASQRRLFFEQQLEQAKDKLADAEEAMAQTQQKTGMIQLDSQARALIESAASIRAQVAAKEVQIQSLRTFATDENAQLVQAQQELDALRAQLSKLGSSESGGEPSLIPGRTQVSAAGLEYVRKLRDVKYNETIFDILARQFEIAKLDEAKQGAVIQVVDKAVPPERRSSPKRGLIVGLSTALGLLVGIVVSLVMAGYQHTRKDSEFVSKLRIVRQNLSLRSSARRR